MATRNLTTRFENFRERRSKHSHASSGLDDGPLLGNEDSTVIRIGLRTSLAPMWVDVVEAVQRNIVEIKSNRMFYGSHFVDPIVSSAIFRTKARKFAHGATEDYIHGRRGSQATSTN